MEQNVEEAKKRQKKWCRLKDLNLHHVSDTDLNRTRLPIPPSRHLRNTIL